MRRTREPALDVMISIVLDPDDLEAARAALAAATGDNRVIRELVELRRGRVARCGLEGDGDTGATVIVKSPNRASPSFQGLPSIHNEIAALAALTAAGSQRSPKLLAADAARGVVVMEDLGEGPSLATAFLGDDPTRAAAAAVAHATAVGALHAESVGLEQEFTSRRSSLGPWDATAARFTLRGLDIRKAIERLPALLTSNELPPPTASVEAEFAAVLQELSSPGDLATLSSGDPCPDNEVFTAEGVKLIDFEAATFRHALVDAAHYVMPFPNCWCWGEVPQDLAEEMLAAHRAQLAGVSEQARDDRRFREALVAVSAAWVIWMLTNWLGRRGNAQVATRSVAVLDNFSRLARQGKTLQAFAAYADELVPLVQKGWGPLAEPLPYPAFGGPPFPRS